jgi:hypothetical protein
MVLHFTHFTFDALLMIKVGIRGEFLDVVMSSLLVFWSHSVFGQNHLYVRMLQTGIPLFRVKSEEFQCSLSAVRTMCHPVRTPICLLLHPTDDVSSRPDARRSSIFRPDDVLLPSENFTVSRSFCASLLRQDVSAARPNAYQFSNGSLILSKFQEREDQSTVWTMWYTVRTRISVRQES